MGLPRLSVGPRWACLTFVKSQARAILRTLRSSSWETRPRIYFFPSNFLVVEGASDQALANRALELEGARAGQVKVLSATGIDGVEDTITAIWRSLVPLWTSDSPYAKRVVALVDKPRNNDQMTRLRTNLKDRLFVLGHPTLEDYLPERLYAKAGEDKTTVLDELRRAQGNQGLTASIKARVSNSAAASIDASDLDSIPVIRDAVRMALSKAGRVCQT